MQETLVTGGTTATLAENELYNALLNKITLKEATVGMIGLGYVGLPNAVSKAKKGYKVIGFDVDVRKIEKISEGISYIEDVPSEELSLAVSMEKLVATTNFEDLSLVDIAVICVPTPIDEYKQPDLAFVKEASFQIAKNLKKGSMVVLESTTYPGTTEDIIVKDLEKHGFVAGEDVFVAYSPERIDPSNKTYNVDNTPRIVGGYTENCTKLACDFYGGAIEPVSSPKVAEMAKVYENTFRYVNIALSNELAVLAEKMDIDVWEVINAAGTKPYGFMSFFPAVGVGGHCIPVDPYYLQWKAKQYDMSTRMIELASDINLNMNDYVISRIAEILNENQRSINGSKIVILGASYKKNVGDVRESAIFRFYKKLNDLNAIISVQDPYVDMFKLGEEVVHVNGIDYAEIANADMVVLLTDHDIFDYEQIAEHASILFDTKNIIKEENKVVGLYKL